MESELLCDCGECCGHPNEFNYNQYEYAQEEEAFEDCYTDEEIDRDYPSTIPEAAINEIEKLCGKMVEIKIADRMDYKEEDPSPMHQDAVRFRNVFQLHGNWYFYDRCQYDPIDCMWFDHIGYWYNYYDGYYKFWSENELSDYEYDYD